MTQELSEAKKQVLEKVKERNIRFMRLWFTDILGFSKSLTINVNRLEEALEEGIGFDGSSVEGYVRIEESDMIAMPDPSAFYVLPWLSGDNAVAAMFCDILRPGGQPFQGDPRYVLKRNLKKAAEKGLTYYVGPELEYFYFKSPEGTEFLDRDGYFDMTLDMVTNLRRETVCALEDLGIEIEAAHHEVAFSQHEVDMKYDEALTMADRVIIYKAVVKQLARAKGIYATFMPKPVFGINGSGMHVHQSLYRGERNAFFDKADPYHLSKLARKFTAGLMKHAPEITAVTCQWVNSYKRLIPGYEAPAYISWGTRNRSALVRVPEYRPGRENATRIEYRSPDPACNPYLAFSVMLAAGLKGIEEEYELDAPVEIDVYQLSAEEREKHGIHTLPGSLSEATELMEQSDLMKECLGEHVFYSFTRNKRAEWDAYRSQVTEYELKRYLPIL